MRAAARPIPPAWLALALLALPACQYPPAPGQVHAAEAGARARTGPAPVVRGTVLDARTRKPVAGARVQVPEGPEATSDVDGRFELRGLAVGWQGPLEASTRDGRQGRNRLRALEPGELEVVLFVR